jgi:ribose 5-phosphate isomerase A
MDPKQRAAREAIRFIRSDSVIGLGTGSTADFFLIELQQALASGKLRKVRGVPTSNRTDHRCRELGIPLLSLSDVQSLDVAVDGADEVTVQLELIKGMGGALLREKMVAQNARSLVIIVDSTKEVPRLGTRSPLPIEVVQFEHQAQARFLKELGCEPALRNAVDGSPFITDNGNYIYDCRFPAGIADPHPLDRALAGRAGIVESGLFLNLAKVALIADDMSVRTIERTNP